MKTKTKLIIEALKSGEAFGLFQLQRYLTEKTRKKVKVNSFSPVLTKISMPEKSDLGHLIQRRKMPKRPYQYKLVDEALKMTTDELYDLSTTKRKDRFTLDQAIKKYPGIRKYVKDWALKTQEYEKTEKSEKVRQPKHESPVGKQQEAFAQEIAALLSNILSQGIVINIDLNIRVL